MGILFTALIAGLIFLICWVEVNDYNKGGVGVSFYMCLALVLVSMLLLTIMFTPRAKPIKVETPIYALTNTNKASGAFFLGIGSFDGEVYISYITKDENGFISIESKEARNSKIIEYNGEPKMVAYRVYPIQCWWAGFPDNNYTKRYFYVPVGSIDYNFNINLNN